MFDFFYVPHGYQGLVKSPFDYWRLSQYNRYLDVKIGTKSLIRSGALKTGVRRLGYVGYAITAFEAGSAYRDDGFSGVVDYAVESYVTDSKLVLPWVDPVIDLYDLLDSYWTDEHGAETIRRYVDTRILA